jgi:hypothetical protein
VVVCPGDFETVCKILHLPRATGRPHYDANGRGAYSGDHPKKIFHAMRSPCCWQWSLDATERDFVSLGNGLSRGSGSDYTLGMDSVRFGRVLGIGTRLAAKTLVEAVDAAMAPNPSAAKAGMPGTTPTRAEAAGAQAAQQVRQTASQVKRTGGGLKEGGRRFGEAVGEPLVRLGGVLWLELTGVFFGIFALFAGSAMWKQRGSLHAASTNHDAYTHFLLLGGMTLVFGYFFVSSFVKAHLRGKRRPRQDAK